jgi:hypothetical protein
MDARAAGPARNRNRWLTLLTVFAIVAAPVPAARSCDTPDAMHSTSHGQRPYTAEDVATATAHLRAICSALPEVTERVSHGGPAFFVRGKRTLCYLKQDTRENRLAIWCPAAPGVQEEMVASDPERFFRPPYVGYLGWLGLRLDVAADWGEVAAVLEESYRLVAPRTLVRRLPPHAE